MPEAEGDRAGDERRAAAAARREAWLAAVGTHLRMPDDRRDDVLDELAVHLRDAVEELIAEGRGVEDAEREALRRLGSPEALGDELRRTHQTTRRLLAGVGGSVWQGLQAGLSGYLVTSVLILPVLFLGAALAAVVTLLLPAGTSLSIGRGAFASYVPLVLLGGAQTAGRSRPRRAVPAGRRDGRNRRDRAGRRNRRDGRDGARRRDRAVTQRAT